MKNLSATIQNLLTILEQYTPFSRQFIKFLFVGAFNTAFAYGVYALFIWLGLHYTLAVFLSTVIGICFSFKTLGAWVFDNKDNRLIFKFFAVYALCYLLNISILTVLKRGGINNLYLAGLISSFLVAMVSFFLNKLIVFKKPNTPAS